MKARRLILLLTVGCLAAGGDQSPARIVADVAQFGTSEFDNARDVALLPDGRVAVVGVTAGAFPGDIARGSFDSYIAVFGSTGELQWLDQFGSSALDAAVSVTADPTGIYVAGEFFGGLEGATSVGDGDAYLRKYDLDGRLRWTQVFGTKTRDFVAGTAVSHGRVYVGGWTLGAFPGHENRGGTDLYLATFTPSGAQRRTEQFGTPAFEWTRSITADRSGAYILAETEGALGGRNLGASDIVVRRYSRSGAARWTRQVGTATGDAAADIDVADGMLAVAAFSRARFPGARAEGPVLVRLDARTGRVRWASAYGDADTGIAGIAIESEPRLEIWAAGTTTRAIGEQEPQRGDGYAIRVNAAGQPIDGALVGTPSYEFVTEIEADASKAVLVGFTGGTFPEAVPSGDDDAFLAVLRV
jgi:hypothetical protein